MTTSWYLRHPGALWHNWRHRGVNFQTLGYCRYCDAWRMENLLRRTEREAEIIRSWR